MNTEVLSKDLKFNPAYEFEWRLQAYGIPILSKWQVFIQQIRLTLKVNRGLWILLHVWFCLARLALRPFCEMFDVKQGDSFYRLLGMSSVFLIWGVGGGAIWYTTGWNISLVLAFPLMVLCLSLILILVFPAQGTTRALQYWNYVPAKHYFNREVSLPEHIRERYELLQEHQFRDVEIFVLEFAADPYLVAVEKSNRPWWLRRKAPVGSWNTGTPTDLI